MGGFGGSEGGDGESGDDEDAREEEHSNECIEGVWCLLASSLLDRQHWREKESWWHSTKLQQEMQGAAKRPAQIQNMDDTDVREFCDRTAWCLRPYHSVAGWCKLGADKCKFV